LENTLRWVADLEQHPASVSKAVRAIEFLQPVWQNGKLKIGYCAETVIGETIIPTARDAARQDNLWETTCFELFIARAGFDGYLEFNFSPSGSWAAYQFRAYRSDCSMLLNIDPPKVCFESFLLESVTVEGLGLMSLEVLIDVPEDWRVNALDLGISVVVEETDGTKSYWALAHPPGKPDFHHKDCFALNLEAPSAT
jgi:hypothetical protein